MASIPWHIVYLSDGTSFGKPTPLRQEHRANDLKRHDIICNGEISAHQTSFSIHLQAQSLNNSNLDTLRDLSGSWAANCAVEFINAYHNFYDAARSRLIDHQNSGVPCPMQHFARGTRAYQILKQSGFAIRSMIPIIYLNIMWWNLRHSGPKHLAEQYEFLRSNLRRCDVDIASGVEFLLCAIANDLDTGTWLQPEWVHLLCRMLSVECKLTEDTRVHLTNCLLEFVTVSDEQSILGWWIPEYVEQVVVKEFTDYAQPLSLVVNVAP